MHISTYVLHIDRGNINCLDAVGFQTCHEPLIMLVISSVEVLIMYMRQPHTALTYQFAHSKPELF